MNYVITDGGITAVIDGKRYTIARDNPVYWTVRDAIQYHKPEEEVAQMFRTADAVRKYTDGEIEIKDGELFYDGQIVHNVVVDRIFDFMTQKLPFDPLLRFLKRCLRNPNPRSVQDLYKFLTANPDMPITEDGCFLGYKGVRMDYKDNFSGKFDNSPGTYNKLPRESCRVSGDGQCGTGFHVGSLQYATSFSQRTVIVKVDPADVVNVPEGTHSWKIITCKYKVLCDYHGPLPKRLHSDTPYDDECVEDVEHGRW